VAEWRAISPSLHGAIGPASINTFKGCSTDEKHAVASECFRICMKQCVYNGDFGHVRLMHGPLLKKNTCSVIFFTTLVIEGLEVVVLKLIVFIHLWSSAHLAY
jgi:hypothetical protein